METNNPKEKKKRADTNKIKGKVTGSSVSIDTGSEPEPEPEPELWIRQINERKTPRSPFKVTGSGAMHYSEEGSLYVNLSCQTPHDMRIMEGTEIKHTCQSHDRRLIKAGTV